jgi:hypothetical protein
LWENKIKKKRGLRMNVNDLIVELQKIEDKTKPVYIYIADIEQINSEIMPIHLVDDSISDRVDINI